MYEFYKIIELNKKICRKFYFKEIGGNNRYIPRSLDVTEIQLLDLIKKAIKKRILSDEFIDMLVNCFDHTIPHIRFCEERMTELYLRQLHLAYQYV